MKLSLSGIGAEIQRILYDYVQAESITNSPGEREAEEFFLRFFHGQPYWQAHPEDVGKRPIPGDPHGRSAVFAMVRGGGPDTVAFVHHSDVVTVEDFKLLKPLAFFPEALEKELKKLRHTLSPEARQDIDSGAWLFGRGVCDMKGGGAVQMALLARYGELVLSDPAALRGTLIVLAVPDEENLSAGMCAAIPLLRELKTQYALRYRLMINSEPHQRREAAKGVFSLGSVGKLMPFVYVRGSLSHAGKVFEGFNPAGVMGEIVRRTELNMDLSDAVGQEASPPPTWLYLRDRKIQYDVSMPLSVAGCLSVLTLHQTPAEVLSKIRDICQESFDAVVQRMNSSWYSFQDVTGRRPRPLPWRTKVTDFATLYAEASASHGEDFQRAYEGEIRHLSEENGAGRLSLLECSLQLVDFVYDYVDDLSPRVVYGLIPPYYPNVSNLFFPRLSPEIRDIGESLGAFTKEAFDQEYISEYFFTGISDLSYTSIEDSGEIVNALKRSMPLFEKLYHIPVEDIEAVSMPCINIGPWGKDFHKLTERVLKEDIYERTPQIIQKAVEIVLEMK